MTAVWWLWRRWRLLVALLVVLTLLVLLVWGPVWAQPSLPVDGRACAPRVLSTTAARAGEHVSERPAQGWAPVALPEVWS